MNVGEKIDAKLVVTSSPNAKGKVNVSVKNYFGNDIFKYSTNFSCDAKGKAVLPLPLENKLPQGIFVVKSEYELADGKKLYDLHRLSIMKFLAGKHRLKEIFAENYGRPWIRADFLQLLERYRQIGIGSTSEMRSWDKKIWDTFLKYDITPTDAYMFTHVDRKSVPAGSLRWVISDPVSQSHLKPNDPSVILGLPRFDANGNLSKEYLADLKKTVAKVVREALDHLGHTEQLHVSLGHDRLVPLLGHGRKVGGPRAD